MGDMLEEAERLVNKLPVEKLLDRMIEEITRLRQVADAAQSAIDAWDQNWTCSRTPGHLDMTPAIERLRVILRPEAEKEGTI